MTTTPRGRWRRLIRPLFYGGVLALSIGGAYALTRRTTAPASVPPAHQHGAIAGGDEAAKPVMLTGDEARRIGVTYATVQAASLAKEVRTVGQITFDETRLTTIAPKIDGWIDQLYVNATGQRVERGQPLLAIYSPMLVTAQEELLLAKRLEGDVASASEDTRRNASDLLASARRRLAYWDIPDEQIAEIERTGQVRKSLTLRAPSSGYVVEKNVLAGQKIMAGEALYKMADLREVWVEGEVFEQDLAGVRVGQLARAEFQALPGTVRAGRISYIYPTLNPETRTARVRVVLPNAGLQLKPGMYATLRIAGTERAVVLSVPRSAVLSTGERNIVFVRDSTGTLLPREVALGFSNDERVEILRGVTQGEIVVASATFLVDAESNLGTALGGMGNMPGMEMTTPPKSLDTSRPRDPKRPVPRKDSTAEMQDMPGMEHAGHTSPPPPKRP